MLILGIIHTWLLFETILVMNIDRVKNEIYLLDEIFEKSKYLVINADMEDRFYHLFIYIFYFSLQTNYKIFLYT